MAKAYSSPSQDLRWLTKTFVDRAATASEIHMHEMEVERLRRQLRDALRSSPEYELALHALHRAMMQLAVARISSPAS
jgi:hypothetical protein